MHARPRIQSLVKVPQNAEHIRQEKGARYHLTLLSMMTLNSNTQMCWNFKKEKIHHMEQEKENCGGSTDTK
jgi:hypothetical protein